jgi:thiamine pyrophosphate-dependent acetolactate synthase large subunit-like protein
LIAMPGSPLHRREVAATLLADRGDLLVVTGLGSPTYDAAAAGDHALNFYLWGAMGGAAVLGLGLALAQPKRRVLVLTGDGEMLMGIGSLATIAVQRPPNLAVVVLDNERYGETGMQPTHTALGADLAAIAAASGIETTRTVTDDAGLKALVALTRKAPGPIFGVVKVAAEKTPLVLPARDGTWLKHRFRGALLGREAP